jgi:hypothetical protein
VAVGSEKRKTGVPQSSVPLVVSRASPIHASASSGIEKVPTVVQAVLTQCYRWYEDHLEGGDVETQWLWMRQLLFKKTRSVGPKHLLKSDTGVPQAGVALVVSREHVATQILQVIQTRARWLQSAGLPLHTVMDDTLKKSFLEDCINEYNNWAEQQEHQL